jgi:hypothetical protein
LKRVFDIFDKEGPDLSLSPGMFELRSTFSEALGGTGFLINERGSIHLTFTKEEVILSSLYLKSGFIQSL